MMASTAVGAGVITGGGLIVGIPLALGVGLFRDRFFPAQPPAPPSADLLAPEGDAVSQGRHISERLFGTEDNPTIRIGEGVPDAVAQPPALRAVNAAPSGRLRDWLPDITAPFRLFDRSANSAPDIPYHAMEDNDGVEMSARK